MTKKIIKELEVGEAYDVKSAHGRGWNKRGIFFGRMDDGRLVFAIKSAVSKKIAEKYKMKNRAYLSLHEYNTDCVKINRKIGRYAYTGNVIETMKERIVQGATYWEMLDIARKRERETVIPSTR